MSNESDTIIIHRGTGHATIRGQQASSLEAHDLVRRLLRERRATILVDSDETLMYRILESPKD